MYSSEEDVLSQVAERYRAGGYLSYFLRRGVTEGDNNRDGTLRAGELADYLYRQFAENQTSLQTSDGQDVTTWQHLVVNRSGVALNARSLIGPRWSTIMANMVYKCKLLRVYSLL